MKLHEMLCRKRFGSFENSPRALVGAAHGGLLFLRQRQNAERKNFVDLSAVEKVSRAFRRELRIVVENDGLGEHGIALPRFTGEHGPGAEIATSSRGFLKLGRRFQQRDELAVLHTKDGVRRPE